MGSVNWGYLSHQPPFIRQRIDNNNMVELAISMEHAMVEGIPLLTADKQLTAYPIDCVW